MLLPARPVGCVSATLSLLALAACAGEPLDGRLYVFDALRAEGRTIGLARDLNCPLCGAA